MRRQTALLLLDELLSAPCAAQPADRPDQLLLAAAAPLAAARRSPSRRLDLVSATPVQELARRLRAGWHAALPESI